MNEKTILLFFYICLYMTVVVGINGVDEQLCGIPYIDNNCKKCDDCKDCDKCYGCWNCYDCRKCCDCSNS